MFESVVSVSFYLRHDIVDLEDIPIDTLIAALEQKLACMKARPDEARGFFTIADTETLEPDE